MALTDSGYFKQPLVKQAPIAAFWIQRNGYCEQDARNLSDAIIFDRTGVSWINDSYTLKDHDASPESRAIARQRTDERYDLTKRFEHLARTDPAEWKVLVDHYAATVAAV
jgi:hypothetical protein